jgi:hypothetical protein
MFHGLDRPGGIVLRKELREAHEAYLTARASMEKEPFYSNGVYQQVTFQHWRFGRVMDRFK